MLPRISTFLCGGLLFGLLAPQLPAQAPSVEPEVFRCQQGQAAAVPRLIEALKSPDEKVRAKAIATLGSFGPIAKPAAPALVDVAVTLRGHAAALQALAKIDDESTRKALRQLLVGGKGRCRCGRSFEDVVSSAGQPMVPHLISLMSEKEVGFNAESALIQIGEPAVPRLIAAMENRGSDSIRPALYRVFAQLGPKAKSAAPALEKRLAIDQGAVRLHLAQALYMVSGSHREAFDVLHNAVRGNNKSQQSEALQCLLQMRCKAPELIPDVLTSLVNGDAQIQSNSIGILVNIGPSAAPALIEALAKNDAKNRSQIMSTLRYIGPGASSAIPVFIKILAGNDSALATLAAESMPAFGPDAKQAVPHLLATVKSNVPSLRLASATALVAIDPQQVPQTIAPLVDLLRGGKADERQQALWRLTSYGVKAKPAVPTLLDLLKTEKLAMRVNIANALSFIDPAQMGSAIPSLIEATQVNENEYGLQRTAVRMLAKLGPRAKSAGPALKELLKDSLKGNSVSPHTIVDCLKKIDAAAEIMPALIEGLNSADRDERETARYLAGDIIGVTALASLDTALANGRLRETPEVIALLKQLRKSSAAANP